MSTRIQTCPSQMSNLPFLSPSNMAAISETDTLQSTDAAFRAGAAAGGVPTVGEDRLLPSGAADVLAGDAEEGDTLTEPETVSLGEEAPLGGGGAFFVPERSRGKMASVVTPKKLQEALYDGPGADLGDEHARVAAPSGFVSPQSSGGPAVVAPGAPAAPFGSLIATTGGGGGNHSASSNGSLQHGASSPTGV